MWDEIAVGYSEWQSTQAPVLQMELSSLCPRVGETVGAYCDRAILLSAAMTDVGRAVNDAFLVDAVLHGLARERPAWSTVLLGLRGSMNGIETVAQLRGRLAEAESREATELAPNRAVTALRACTATSAEGRLDALESRNMALAAQVEQLTVRGTGRRSGFVNFDAQGPSGRAPVACFRCGSTAHRVKNCPCPYARQGTR